MRTLLIDEAWAAARQAKEAGAIMVLGGPHLTPCQMNRPIGQK